ncbi:GntR family transcriptional regulator [Caldimonas thermodepolymerans]|uniref:GntR family transcriptional regulator n=2 Tax=Caldimonas thermodepolymerans TaxID=215580 RepID=A0AA46HV36_9BURK|nr:GntR family transcriptional regulator [Caldimonas thermodepolymerans]TCP05914.1 GntR family transcriptional regulator [Caldimonas thermodepolymerans]
MTRPMNPVSASAPTRRSLVDVAVEKMRERLERGEWRVGARIPVETELAAQLDVGRNTVREAVRVLAYSGVLEVRQGDGTYVRSAVDASDVPHELSRATLREHLEVRAMLEVEAARLAARRRTPEDLEAIRAALLLRGERLNRRRPSVFVEHDLAFHRAVVAAAHNAALAKLYQFFERAVRSTVRATLELKGLPEPDYPAHVAVCEAIARRNEQAAVEAARALLQPILDSLDPVPAPPPAPKRGR